MSAFWIFFLQIKKSTFENLPVADSKVYECIFDFLQMKKLNFEKLPVADSQVYKGSVEVFLMFLCK